MILLNITLYTHVLHSTVWKFLTTSNNCKFLLIYKWMFCIAFFTNETLALLQSVRYLIIIFCSRGSEWKRKIPDNPPKCQCISFWPHHINQPWYSVLKQKNVYNKNLLHNVNLKSYCTLLIFCVAFLSLNSCFNTPGKRYVKIFHHLHRCEMLLLLA